MKEKMNIEHRILNKVFCQFINWRSEAISSFDVGRSMFDLASQMLCQDTCWTFIFQYVRRLSFNKEI
jgi:hypothetical protein